MARRGAAESSSSAADGGEAGVTEDSSGADVRQGMAERRQLRSQYLVIKNMISDGKDDMTTGDSSKFEAIINQVESLHEFVQKPREQVADAEALLDIANTLVTSVRSQTNEGLTPSDFVATLLKKYGRQGAMNSEGSPPSLRWDDIGTAVSHVFMLAPGCCTMVGLMNTEVKQRTYTTRKRTRKPTETARPDEIAESSGEQKTDTDRNMLTIFEILRAKKSVRLENLILNRASFSQTVENIFALSFLVKDGRVEIDIDGSKCHVVRPRNAPQASAIASGEVSFSHFVFRFDFADWMLMKDSVPVGEELMPHRTPQHTYATGTFDDADVTGPPSSRTPIRKLTRNRGLVIHEEMVVEETPEFSQDKRRRLYQQ